MSSVAVETVPSCAAVSPPICVDDRVWICVGDRVLSAPTESAPTWLALNYSPYWRWLVDRRDTPWYPTMRLFRQQQPGDWPGVFREMAGELQRLVEASPRRPILIEVTQEELQERMERIEAELNTADTQRVHALRGELARLRAIVGRPS